MLDRNERRSQFRFADELHRSELSTDVHSIKNKSSGNEQKCLKMICGRVTTAAAAFVSLELRLRLSGTLATKCLDKIRQRIFVHLLIILILLFN